MESFAPSRNERKQQVRGKQKPYSRTESEWTNTGAFNGSSRPRLVGVSDTVAMSNRRMAAAARRAERSWLKSLPKGVKI